MGKCLGVVVIVVVALLIASCSFSVTELANSVNYYAALCDRPGTNWLEKGVWTTELILRNGLSWTYTPVDVTFYHFWKLLYNIKIKIEG